MIRPTSAPYTKVSINGYEDLFADSSWSPREKTGEMEPLSTEDAFPSSNGRLPAELEEFKLRRELAQKSREEASEMHDTYKIGDMLPEHIFTMERAIGYYGTDIVRDKKVDAHKLGSAQIQVSEALSKDQPGYIDTASFIITALALHQMSLADQDGAERQAAVAALSELQPLLDDPDKLRREQRLGYQTGELAVQAILEHQPAE